MLFTRFLSVGVINSAIGYGIIFFSMYVIGLSPTASNAIGYAVGLIVSYVLHRDFTFKVANDERGRALRFLLVFALSYLANLLTLVFLVDQLMINKVFSQIGAGIVYVAVSFTLGKYYVFKAI